MFKEQHGYAVKIFTIDITKITNNNTYITLPRLLFLHNIEFIDKYVHVYNESLMYTCAM